MSSLLNLKIIGFSIKPASLKPKKEKAPKKQVIKVLYCIARKENGEWKAYINTKGIENYKDVTILNFTPKSFILKGKTNIFSKEKDKTNHYVRIIRSINDSYIFEGNDELYCSLCENRVFSGHIVTIDGVSYFDMKEYQGNLSQCKLLVPNVYCK